MSAANHIPAGYKRTEVGIIPDDWQVKRLGEVAEIVNGGTPSTSNPDYWDGHILWCTPTDITRTESKYLTDTERKISESGLQNSSANLLPKGTLLLCTRATIGELKIATKPTTTNQGFKSLVCNHGINNEWMYYKLVTIKSELIKRSFGSTFLEISKKNISDILIPLPPLPEQTAIAEVLSDTDDWIAAQEALIAKKRALKTATMQQLLTGRTRLPGFNYKCNKYKVTSLGILPEDWKVRSIQDFTYCISGGTPDTRIQEYWGGDIRWMSSGELNNRIIIDVFGRITQSGLDNSSAKLVPINCVLIGLAGQGKTRGTVAINKVPITTNQSIASIFPNSSYNSIFLYYYLDSQYDELRELSSGGGGRGGLNLRMINKLQIPFPSVSEQTAIAAVLSDMDAELEALEAKLAKSRALKQGLMQELLTGRTRLLAETSPLKLEANP